MKKGNRSKTGIILLHDYSSDRTMLYPVAQYLALHDYIVILPDLPGSGRNRNVPAGSLATSNISNSYWLRSLCMINALTKYAYAYLKIEQIYAIGVFSGSSLALLAEKLIRRINVSISIGLIGNYSYNIAEGSLLSYVISNPEYACTDPLYIAKSAANTEGRSIILIGSEDEYVFLDTIGHYPSTIIITKLNADHASLLPHWRMILNKILDGKWGKRIQQSRYSVESDFPWYAMDQGRKHDSTVYVTNSRYEGARY
jgi:esterase/lipase